MRIETHLDSDNYVTDALLARVMHFSYETLLNSCLEARSEAVYDAGYKANQEHQ